MKNHIRYILVLQLFFAGLADIHAQADRHDVRVGNRKFNKEKWAEADIAYRKALVKDSLSFAANYNLANNLYRQGNMQEASSYMGKLKDAASLSSYGTSYYYNVGDIALAQKDWQGAVDAFKQALLRAPDDLDAKENYIYAKKMLENQDKKGQDNNQDNKDNKDNKDKEQNQDQNRDENQGDKPDENKGRQDKSHENQEMKISPQQAQQMLKAIQAKEKETQDKVNREKAALLKSKQKEKNW